MDNITNPNFISSVLKTGTPSPYQNPVQQPQGQSQGLPQKIIRAKDGTPLDAGVVNLARAIRQQESGGNYNAVGDNGTSHGAYQWNKDHFAEGAKQFGLNPNDFSPENQDKVAYKQIEAYKNAGYSPDQIASTWNSGSKDPMGKKGTAVINGKPVNYDTPVYVAKVMSNFNQFKQQTPGEDTQQLNSTGQPVQSESPSIGGFAKNVVQSGANFVGGVGEALLHPLKTAQNLGSTALGVVEKLGGQSNENTQNFDSLVNHFKDRYGGVDKLLHTAYTDPVGLAADISAVLGVGGGAIGAVGKGAELGGLTDLADTAGSISKRLGTASELTNPLTPVIKGVGALANKSSGLVSDTIGNIIGKKGSTVRDVVANPQDYTTEQIANTSRAGLAQQVEQGLTSKIESLGETGAAYQPLREVPSAIKVEPDFLDNAIRQAAKVDITDGVIKANSASVIRDASDIKELQNIYNTYKPDFLAGTMDSNKFLNLRSDLADTANFNKGLTKNIQRVSADLRSSLNETYRPQIGGLESTDANYSTQLKELKKLRKGFLDKEGNLTEAATNKIANSLGKGKDAQLGRLEEIIPGITRKLQVLKAIEDLQKESPGIIRTIAETGGVGAAIAQGNIPLLAGTIATAIITQPEYAVPLLRAFGKNQELLKAVIVNLSKYTNIGEVSNGSLDTSSPTSESQSTGQVPQLPKGNDPSQISTPPQESPVNLSSSNSSTSKFNIQGALAAGYTQKEIDDFVKTLH